MLFNIVLLWLVLGISISPWFYEWITMQEKNAPYQNPPMSIHLLPPDLQVSRWVIVYPTSNLKKILTVWVSAAAGP
jgi:hypothetical protein